MDLWIVGSEYRLLEKTLQALATDFFEGTPKIACFDDLVAMALKIEADALPKVVVTNLDP